VKVASEDATLAWDGSVTTLEPMAAASHTLRQPRALSLNSTSRVLATTGYASSAPAPSKQARFELGWHLIRCRSCRRCEWQPSQDERGCVAEAESSLRSDLAVAEMVGGGEAYPFAAGLAMGKTWSVRRDR